MIPRGLFAAIDDACPRLQQSYLDDEIEAPSGWTKHDNTYLAFGDTYAEERRGAQRHGWPTVTIPGGHLHFLHDPDGVAAAVLRLADRSP